MYRSNSISALIFAYLILMFTLPIARGQEEDETDPETEVIQLVQQLRNLSILQLGGGDKAIIARQRKKIDLAKQILDHEFKDESHRLFATVTRLQALGIQFSIALKNEDENQALFDEYKMAIEEGLDDSDERIAAESIAASASFHSAIFVVDSIDENATEAANALIAYNNIAPEDPRTQSTRRLLLEQIWASENPRSVFERLTESDEKMASIVLDRLDEKTSREKAEFLWAKHFSKFGDFVALRRLATMYENGIGTRVSDSQAARLYTKLARVGNLDAKIKLGDFYLEGKGYSKNPEAAVRHYREAANKRSRVAQFKLGLCYLNGSGVKPSDENWRKWIKNAAFNATGFEVQEIYTAIDFKDAADSYRIFYDSMVEQEPDDIYYLNNFAYSLLISSEKDPTKALEMINKAIELAPDDFSGISNFLDTKATALQQLKKWEEAATMFEKVLDDVDDKKPVLEALIECYSEFDKSKAQEYRDRLTNLATPGKRRDGE